MLLLCRVWGCHPSSLGGTLICPQAASSLVEHALRVLRLGKTRAVAAPGLGGGWQGADGKEQPTLPLSLPSAPVLPDARVGAAPPALCASSVLSVNGGEGRGATPLLSPSVPGAPSDPSAVLVPILQHYPSPLRPRTLP
eukprot:1265174-Rhodomonas_salina.1